MNKTELNRERSAIDAYQFRYVKYHGKLDDGLQEVEEYAQHRMNWLRKYGAICLCCDNAPANTLDHIVPVNLGGKHRTNNIGYICKDCNSSKNDGDFESWLIGKPQALQDAYNEILQGSDYVKETDPDKIWKKYVADYLSKHKQPVVNIFELYRNLPPEMRAIYNQTKEHALNVKANEMYEEQKRKEAEERRQARQAQQELQSQIAEKKRIAYEKSIMKDNSFWSAAAIFVALVMITLVIGVALNTQTPIIKESQAKQELKAEMVKEEQSRVKVKPAKAKKQTETKPVDPKLDNKEWM